MGNAQPNLVRPRWRNSTWRSRDCRSPGCPGLPLALGTAPTGDAHRIGARDLGFCGGTRQGSRLRGCGWVRAEKMGTLGISSPSQNPGTPGCGHRGAPGLWERVPRRGFSGSKVALVPHSPPELLVSPFPVGSVFGKTESGSKDQSFLASWGKTLAVGRGREYKRGEEGRALSAQHASEGQGQPGRWWGPHLPRPALPVTGGGGEIPGQHLGSGGLLRKLLLT